jgi:hypothetical protein
MDKKSSGYEIILCLIVKILQSLKCTQNYPEVHPSTKTVLELNCVTTMNELAKTILNFKIICFQNYSSTKICSKTRIINLVNALVLISFTDSIRRVWLILGVIYLSEIPV